MRAVIVVVVFCFYCVVSYRPSTSLSITSALVVESGFESSRPLVKTCHIPLEDVSRSVASDLDLFHALF